MCWQSLNSVKLVVDHCDAVDGALPPLKMIAILRNLLRGFKFAMNLSKSARLDDLDGPKMMDTSSASLISVDGSATLATAQAARRRRRLMVNILRILVLVAILGSWEVTTRIQVYDTEKKKMVPLVDPFFYGQPSGVVLQLRNWVVNGTSEGSLWEQIGVTLEEAVLGFIAGVVLGITLGIVLGRVPLLADVFGPFIKIVNSIPRIVLGSILIIALGYEIESKVVLSFVLVFFVVFFNAFEGVREVDRNLIANAKILGASPWQLSREVILPSALSWIIASLHTSFSFSLVGAIVGEFLGAYKGLGQMISIAQGEFNPNGVFAVMFILATVTLTMEA